MKKQFLTRLTSFLLSISIGITASPISIFAQTTITDEKMKESLNDEQYFAYVLQKYLSDTEYNLNSTLTYENDHYFIEQTKNGLLDVLSFNSFMSAFSQNFDKKYLKDAMANAISLEGLEEELLDAQTEGYIEYYSNIYDLLKENDEEIFEHAEELSNAVSTLKDVAESASETGKFINRVSSYQSTYLQALRMVKNSTDDSSLESAAKSILKTATSTGFVDAYGNYWENYLENNLDSYSTTVLDYFLLGIPSLVNSEVKMLIGDKPHDDLLQMYYMGLQSNVKQAAYKITSKYGLVNNADYSYSDLCDLTTLTLFYLRVGELGFDDGEHNKSLKKCKKARIKLSNMNIPTGTTTPKDNDIQICNFYTPADAILSEGDKFVVSGTIESDVLIESVSIDITGDSKLHVEKNVGATSFDIHSMDNEITIDQLPVGNYTYSITVKTKDSDKQIISEPFSIKPEDGNIIITNYTLPHPISQGSVSIVKGDITTQTELSEVKIQVFSDEGNMVIDARETTNGYSYQLNNLDSKITFDQLEKGMYTYEVTVELTDGNEETIIRQPFVVF